MFLEEVFFEVGAILVIAAALSMIAHRLRQPLIIAYIIAGILVGPGVLGLTHSPEVFDVMSKIGVAFLLFTVGLGLNWRSVKEVGGISLATGVGQVIFTSLIGFLVGRALGFETVPSAYMAVAFAFSSTIIIIKLLMDKEDLDTLYGRISVGFLLVQDFIAMVILLGLGAFQSGASVQDVLTSSLLKGLIIIPILWFTSAKLVPRIVAYAAKSQELLFIYSIAWCFLIAGLLAFFGFGIEIGALIAGVTLSGTVFEKEINARIRPLRDFFLIMFFVFMGTHLGFGNISSLILPAVLFSIFILIGNPIIVLFVMRALGYHPRTGFLAGTTVAQISEFSLIVITVGIAVGHLGNEILSLSTMVAIITITASSYLIEKNDQIYTFIRPLFRWLEPKDALPSELPASYKPPQVFLIGYHHVGKGVLSILADIRQTYAIIDFDPQVVRDLSNEGHTVYYGDAGDQNFLEELKVHHARFVISTIPNLSVSLSLLNYLKGRGFDGTVIVGARTPEEAERCYEEGATYVIVPNLLGNEKLKELFEKQKTRKTPWVALGERLRPVLLDRDLKS